MNLHKKKETKQRINMQFGLSLTKTMTKKDAKDVNITVKELEERVNNLYEFRDNYFQSHPLEEAGRKWEHVEEELEKVMHVFGNRVKKVESKDRALYLYLLGKALNVLQEYKPESEELLTKAIKLDSKLYQAWNELGETYWKRNSLNEAKSCFLGAIEQENNKESLRNLSILMRTRDFWNLKYGMVYAKEAVELDPKDGRSWLVLGNAYTSLYGAQQNAKILEMCKKAYGIAEKDSRVKRDPSLYYNRGVVERFLDDYSGALASFEKAESLDPMWKEPGMEKSKILEYLDKAQSFASEKAKLKGKKLRKLLKTVNPRVDLGKNRNLKCVTLMDLKKGANKGKVVAGVVAATFPEESRFNLVFLDIRECSAIVNIYNLPEERGILVGSIVAIPEPAFGNVKITWNDRNYEFFTIRVENASALTVNGKSINSAKREMHFITTSIPD